MSSILSVGLCKTLSPRFFIPVVTVARSIKSKHATNLKRPPPFPYKTKDFGVFSALFEDTEDRFNENTKIITVEGPIGSGKTEFCKKLADELDMICLPPANMDMLYIYDNGFDFRSLDNQFSSENMKIYDEKTFCRNPNHRNTGVFQIRMLQLRFSLYVDAVAHMLSTGQGVVLQRSPFSDYVFAEALVAAGYISRRVKDIYYDLCRYTMPPLFKPHLVIYLDTPVSKVKENIKKRNLPWEVDSPVFKNDVYLQKIEDTYKNEFLPNISNNSEVLVYDWAEGGDHEVVVEDIERIDFDNYDSYNTKLKEWRELTTAEWNVLRVEFADQKQQLMVDFNIIERYDAPELCYTADEMEEFTNVVKNTPEIFYESGYNPLKDNVLFKAIRNPKERRLNLPFVV